PSGARFARLRRAERLVRLPELLPAPLDVGRVITRHGKMAPCPAIVYRIGILRAESRVHKGMHGNARRFVCSAFALVWRCLWHIVRLLEVPISKGNRRRTGPGEVNHANFFLVAPLSQAIVRHNSFPQESLKFASAYECRLVCVADPATVHSSA